jgi:hypothetical protein
MSTAGKVLIALIILVLPIWIMLVSAVAQLNSEWRQALAKQKQQVESLEQQIAKNEQDIAQTRDTISTVLDTAQEQQTVLRSKIADVERSRANAAEILSAVNVQLSVLKGAVAGAEKARDQRAAEKMAEIQGKETAEKEVEQLKIQNNELMNTLAQLREEFKATLEANKKLIRTSSRR